MAVKLGGKKKQIVSPAMVGSGGKGKKKGSVERVFGSRMERGRGGRSRDAGGKSNQINKALHTKRIKKERKKKKTVSNPFNRRKKMAPTPYSHSEKTRARLPTKRTKKGRKRKSCQPGGRGPFFARQGDQTG